MISLCAPLKTLKSVHTIACEDTRQTRKLLSHFDIHKPLLSCHANNEEHGAQKIIEILNGGNDVAYCSDAGTPALSDPGALLAKMARAKGHTVVPIPGPSAFACLISAAGMSSRTFVLMVFIDKTQQKARALAGIA